MSDITEHNEAMAYEHRLEELLDESSLGELLETLAAICYAKEEHLCSNWQDKNTAKIWHRAGLLIEKLSMSTDIL